MAERKVEGFELRSLTNIKNLGMSLLLSKRKQPIASNGKVHNYVLSRQRYYMPATVENYFFDYVLVEFTEGADYLSQPSGNGSHVVVSYMESMKAPHC